MHRELPQPLAVSLLSSLTSFLQPFLPLHLFLSLKKKNPPQRVAPYFQDEEDDEEGDMMMIGDHMKDTEVSFLLASFCKTYEQQGLTEQRGPSSLQVFFFFFYILSI